MTWCFQTTLRLPKGQLSFVEKWPLMNPNEVVFVLATYLVFVLKIGPLMMNTRASVQMKGFLLFYNAVKVLMSATLGFNFLSYILDNGLFPRRCEHDEHTLYRIAALYWKYMAIKILDLSDTVFFVLRKKQNQLTFLHVYHHTFMVIITWSCLKYDPSDHWAFMAVVNCFIHVLMYTYYGMAALGPRFAEYLLWKKYLTLMQLVQFALVIAHLVIQTNTSQCPIHAGSYWVGLSNLMLFICLFADFYNKRYRNGFACTVKQSID